MIVDFSQFAGKTLILYNDAPAAFPARVPGVRLLHRRPGPEPDRRADHPARLRPQHPHRHAGEGRQRAHRPRRSTCAKLQTAFSHNADGSGVFESGQHPIIVGQAAYNSAYGTNFAASGNCNSPTANPRQVATASCGSTTPATFKFNTLKAPATKTIDAAAAEGHPRRDELDDLRRVRPDAGQPRHRGAAADPGAQNVILYPYVNPQTELIDATNLPNSARATSR